MNEPLTFADLQDAGNAQSHLILLAVARHADWDTGECFPCVKTLARMAKCSEKTARRHLARLEADSLIEREERKREDGGRAPDLIRLVGYKKWIETNRKGGRVNKPKSVPKYEDPPLVNMTSPPGHNGSRAPGQQGDQGKNSLSIVKRTKGMLSHFDEVKTRKPTTVRDTSESFTQYRARMLAEGKLQ